MRIAAFVDEDGKVLPILSSGMIHIYEINGTQYSCVDRFFFSLESTLSIGTIRDAIRVIGTRLSGCIAFIVNRSMAIFNALFERELHLKLFFVTGNPVVVLPQIMNILREQIVAAIECIEERKQTDRYQPFRVKYTDLKCFRIFFDESTENWDEGRMRESIISFLNEINYDELEIVCLKVPQWLEPDLLNRSLVFQKEFRKDGFCHAFVRPK